MTKLVEFLVRADGYDHDEFVERWRGDHDEFVERWRGDHADVARELPGLKRYTTSVPADPDDAGYDGVLELAFESPAALAEAFDSEVGRKVMADAAEFVDVGAGPRMVVEETVHVDETAAGGADE